MKNNQIVVDVESASLRGEAFDATLIHAKSGKVLSCGHYDHSCMTTSEWHRNNVSLSGEKYPNKNLFLSTLASSWGEARFQYGEGEYNSLEVVAHMGSPVESNLFQLLFKEGLMGEFEGLMHIHDTGTILQYLGYKGESEKFLLETEQVQLKDYREHTSLSDAKLTREVWSFLHSTSVN